jgi:two-component system cell cycle sensor histidine kinase/response regulator CckA
MRSLPRRPATTPDDDYERTLQTLERRVEEHTRALTEASRALQAEIEDRRRLEAELRQAQKLEAIGHLAGGVAHDFNNILMVIQGYTDLLLAEAGARGTMRSDLREIQEAARRGSDLTRQLLAFGRKQVLTIRPLDLNAILVDTSHLLTRLLGESVKLELQTAAVPCPIEADRVQLEQVLMNLAVNARDAMSGRGTLTIALDRVTPDAGTLGLPPGTYARLTVRDTGCGMDEQTRARIFEPFFTTKGPGKGSGLGLSTVYGVVKQLGGHVGVASTPLQGTTFTVHLPATTKRLAAQRKVPAVAPPARAKAETVLLVEDDHAVRAVVENVLRRHGYAVLPASGPREALAAARQHTRTIDLVLSDVIMPDMSGPEMVTLLAERHPETRAVYLSGYSAEALVREGLLESSAPLVQKPVATGELLAAMRAALHGAPTDPAPDAARLRAGRVAQAGRGPVGRAGQVGRARRVARVRQAGAGRGL